MSIFLKKISNYNMYNIYIFKYIFCHIDHVLILYLVTEPKAPDIPACWCEDTKPVLAATA